MTALGGVRQFHRPADPAAPPLVVCPHAGTGASSYRAYSAAFSRNFDVVALQYPGRQDRMKEPAASSIHELGTGAFDEFSRCEHHSGAPITVFGHSMGGIVAFEFARAAEAAGCDVRLLAVSAVPAPSRIGEHPRHPRDDDAILDRLIALGGTDPKIAANRDLLRMALPVLKADYSAIDAYSCAPDIRIDAPIHAFGGDEDPIVSVGDLHGWRPHTDAGLEVSLFSGGHFYLESRLDELADALAAPPVAVHR